MRISETIVAAGLLSITAAVAAPREAAAQTPAPTRDQNWDLASNITMVVGVSLVSLWPRVYYNDPEATVGWKARWHFSALAPIMTLTAATLLVDGPIKSAIQGPRPGCVADDTTFKSECASLGSPSTQSYASWSATGAGVGIFLVDTFKFSDGRFNAPNFIGNIALPLTLSVITSGARSAASGADLPHEDVGQIVAGTLSGFVSGLVVGAAYSILQRPACPYGNSIVCW